jgi:hypothetical protein
VSRPEKDAADDKNWVIYTEWSGSIWITLELVRKSEDTTGRIKSSSLAQMYAENDEFKENGDYDLSMPEAPTTKLRETTYHGRKSGVNTVSYTTTDSQKPRPRELEIFYYRTTKGNMYKLTVGYPGKGDFTARGREVARAAIAGVDIEKP